MQWEGILSPPNLACNHSSQQSTHVNSRGTVTTFNISAQQNRVTKSHQKARIRGGRSWMKKELVGFMIFYILFWVLESILAKVLREWRNSCLEKWQGALVEVLMLTMMKSVSSWENNVVQHLFVPNQNTQPTIFVFRSTHPFQPSYFVFHNGSGGDWGLENC